MARGKLWRLWIDSGGTFTDCLAVDPDGALRRCKLLSSGAVRARVRDVDSDRRMSVEPPAGFPTALLPGMEVRSLRGGARARIVAVGDGKGDLELDGPLVLEPGRDREVELSSGEEAPVLAARWVTATPLDAKLPLLAVRLASTRGTNALLEGKGAPTALFVTRGFADLLEIGDQKRPDLFALRIEKPPPLYEAVVEVDERLAADGSVVEDLDLESVAEASARLLAAGVRVAAVALLHSYRNPRHERRLGRRLAGLGFEHISLSSQLSPRIKILGRAQTAVVDAYLSAVLSDYLASVQRGLAPRSFHLMTSSGGLRGAAGFRPKDSLLSGPAAGVLGAVVSGRRAGGERLLAFDMGGTSTDVSRFGGALEYREETVVGRARLSSTSVAVETVAAGGGSVCSHDGRQLKVGPESAGASPGPACYGGGGPLTLTDVNLLLGRIDERRFAFRVDRAAAQEAATALLTGAADGIDQGSVGRLERGLAGLLRIANEKMAAAVRRTAVRMGYRTGEHWLVAFGGAGPQHACAVAELLGVETVLVPADAALLSALGLGAARIERLAVRQVLAPCDEVEKDLARILGELESEARRGLRREGLEAERTQVRARRAHLRLAGQESTLETDVAAFPRPGDLAAAFRRRYRKLFGYDPGERPVELERLEVLVAGDRPALPGPSVRDARDARDETPSTSGERRLYAAGQWKRAWAVDRADLEPGAKPLAGPGLVLERHSVTVVEPGWCAAGDPSGAIVMKRDTDGG